MELRQADIRSYEGLVISTAAMYHHRVPGMDFDDVAQVLRLTVAQALVSYDTGRATQRVDKYVFMCCTNRVKDLVSRRVRPEVSLEEALEDDRATRRAFEGKYLSTDDEPTYALVEDDPVRLPSTVTELEARVLVLLLRDYGQTEVARELGLSRQKVRGAVGRLRRKLADWEPDGLDETQPVSHLPSREDSARQAAA